MSSIHPSRFISHALLVLVILTTASCGGSSSSTDNNGGGGGGGGGGSSFLAWSGNVNNTIVEDANGNAFKFDASNGCMFGANTLVGPSGFCLTPAGSSYAAYGATNCSNPSSNSLCNTATFDVMLTDNPGGSGCISVLSAGGANILTAQALAVTDTGSGFNIQAGTSAGAFTVYWNGYVPVCGGSSDYQGNYTYASTGVLPPGTGCTQQFNSPALPGTFVTIDSGGVIDHDGAEIIGVIADGGTGSFTAQDVFGGALKFTITSVTGSSGSWVISGTGGDCTGSWSLTQN